MRDLQPRRLPPSGLHLDRREISAAEPLIYALRGTAPRCVILHDVKQPAGRLGSARPISFPRRVFRVRVVASSFFVSTASPLHLPLLRLGSRPHPWHQQQLRPRTEGQAERREAYCLTVALVRRDATLARRGPSRATGTPPLGAPPWHCRPRNRSGTVFADPARRLLAASHFHGGLRHQAFRSRAHRRGETPLPAPSSGSSPETPPMSEDGESILQLRCEVNR